eukprot:GHVU01136477.1.p1 GENE.GHVU01136477.1~~GHVU01136477.1.p1  ORF type:complete len:108 (-),score=41.21 GHVU01136477.1:3-326(-)
MRLCGMKAVLSCRRVAAAAQFSGEAIDRCLPRITEKALQRFEIQYKRGAQTHDFIKEQHLQQAKHPNYHLRHGHKRRGGHGGPHDDDHDNHHKEEEEGEEAEEKEKE